MTRKRVLIVGGVAGSASCAARLRRMDEAAEIIVFERGPYVSFANCGLPYYVGDVIHDEAKLLLATPELFRMRFQIDVRTGCEAIAIDRAARTLTVRTLATGEESVEPYDALVLSPGAAPIKPALPGVDLPGVFTMRNVPDSRALRGWIDAGQAKNAIVVGGGFIGLEMAENLAHRGLNVTILEKTAQLLPPLDPELATYAQEKLLASGVTLKLGEGLASIEKQQEKLIVHTDSKGAYEADLVVLAMGVRPETALAQSAGLTLGERGGIRVDEQMRSSDQHIWAVGDAVEVRNRITGQWELIPLAGPANRQGRIAADVIAGRSAAFHGVQATTVCGFFGLTAALTGASEKSLQRAGVSDYQSIYLHPGHHVGYYPGAQPIHLKLLFRPSDGRLLGAQAVGVKGVERRIDVIATMIQLGGTVYDLEEAELCYAPQFGAAKDPVNMAGMIASNHMRGDLGLADWRELKNTEAFVLDVREPKEFAAGTIPHAVNIPLGELRSRLAELPGKREIWVSCGVGQRAYYACRILAQHGFTARNLSGGYNTFRMLPEDWK
ncbi:FAD-dependent oxidoreductase [Telmatobacter bradus]|uniref:FAD-dependent oxidoreductase n=1 Tax=Telmatobacter bradus TaxID=474953 RepID=UPI003B43D2E6